MLFLASVTVSYLFFIAAHCLVSAPGNKIISYKSLVVYLGKYNLRQYTGETGVQTKEVKYNIIFFNFIFLTEMIIEIMFKIL